MNDLLFKLIPDDSGSGLSVGYLSSADHRFIPITKAHAQSLWELLATVSKSRGAIILWFGIDAPTVLTNGARTVSAPDKHYCTPVFWKAYTGVEAFSDDLIHIWNSGDAVRIYAAESDGDLPDAVSRHFFDRRDAQRLGLDHRFAPSRGVFSALGSVFRATARFSGRLLNSQFREELCNPFLRVADTELVQQTGIYLYKGGGDEVITLELLTDAASVDELLLAIFDKHNIRCGAIRERRSSWGS